MKSLALPVFFAGVMAVFAVPAHSQENKAPEDSKTQDGNKPPETNKKSTPLEDQMRELNKAYKELGNSLKQPQDSDKEAYLKLVETIKAAVAKAHDLVPLKAQKLPDDQQKAMVEAYQKDMETFAKTIDDLSQAIKDGKWDDARNLVATMKMEKSKGHRAYEAEH